MISKRRSLPGPMMKDVGRDGSQNCAAVSGSFTSAAPFDLQIDDQPGLVEHEVFECDAERLSHSARGTVAGNHVVCRDGTRRPACRRADATSLGSIRRSIETEQFGPQFDVTAFIRPRMLEQLGLAQAAAEAQARSVTKRIGLRNHIDPAYQLTPGAKMLEAGNGAIFRRTRSSAPGCPTGEGSHGRSRSREACRRHRADGRSPAFGYCCLRAGWPR